MQAWAGLCFLLCVHLTARGMLREAAGGAAVGSAPRPAIVDLNTARIPELMVLPGIGGQRAEAIVLHRVRHGPFRRPEDLLAVDGIGPGILAGIRPHVRTGQPTVAGN